MSKNTTEIGSLEDAIGIPVQQWVGRCHEIAGAAIEAGMVKGELCYGMYMGPVDEKSSFARHGIRGFYRHGWVQMEGGKIFDPTRWTFDSPEEPYIYEGPHMNQYDFGMEKLRIMIHEMHPQPCPEFSADRRNYALPENKHLAMFIKAVCGIDPDVERITDHQVFWLANRPPSHLGSNVVDVFQWIADVGHLMFIPIDFQRRYLGE